MVISWQKSSKGQISTTIELEKSFPGDHFAEKIILTTDFSGIINTKFPQGLIWRFINHKSNKKNYNSAIVNFMEKYLWNEKVLKILNFKFINFRSISLFKTIFGRIWGSFIFLLIFTAKYTAILCDIIIIYPQDYKIKIIIVSINYNNFKNTFLTLLDRTFTCMCLTSKFNLPSSL